VEVNTVKTFFDDEAVWLANEEKIEFSVAGIALEVCER